MRTALRTSQKLRAFHPRSTAPRSASTARRSYADNPRRKSDESDLTEEGPMEGDTAADEDALLTNIIDGGPDAYQAKRSAEAATSGLKERSSRQGKKEAAAGNNDPRLGGDAPSSMA